MENKGNSYVAIDVETTGLDPKRDKIIEIGAVKVIDGAVTETKTTLVNPGLLLPERIQDLTGIDDAMVASAPAIGEVIGEYTEFSQGLPLLGHQINFDYRFLKRAAVNEGLAFERDGIDTLYLCRRFMPKEEKKNLTDACAWFSVEPCGAHRAYHDAYSAHLLYEALRRAYFSENREAFLAKALIYKVKKEQPASKRQKEGLRELLKYHKINIPVQIDRMTRSEVSRMTDKIISQYGRIV